jgi:hypothetical protein
MCIVSPVIYFCLTLNFQELGTVHSDNFQDYTLQRYFFLVSIYLWNFTQKKKYSHIVKGPLKKKKSDDCDVQIEGRNRQEPGIKIQDTRLLASKIPFTCEEFTFQKKKVSEVDNGTGSSFNVYLVVYGPYRTFYNKIIMAPAVKKKSSFKDYTTWYSILPKIQGM